MVYGMIVARVQGVCHCAMVWLLYICKSCARVLLVWLLLMQDVCQGGGTFFFLWDI